MKNFLVKYKYQLSIFLAVFIIFLFNYQTGSYLSGWDSLQTELNPGLAVKRAFSSVWEEYQSFGLVAGMAHSADLPRAIFLWFISFLLPQNMIRYFFHFLMLLIGGLGAFKLLHRFLKDKRASLIGALFYILNIGTVQIFFVPYESFSSFFAFLPWGIWSFYRVTDNVERRTYKNDLLLFFLINLLGAPAFYTQQLFVVYTLVLGCIAIGSIVRNHKNATRHILHAILAFALILIINSFWILPQVYFLKANGAWVSQSKASQIATEDTLYQNLEKGTIGNFLRLEGFYYDLKGIKNTDLFAPWKDHFSGIYQLLPYLFALLAGIGLIGSIVKKKNLELSLILGFCALALLSATTPFSWINSLIRENRFINQIFRSPFTKFIILYSLVYSYFFARGVKIIFDKLKKNTLVLNIKYLAIVILIILYSLPSFQGFFISPEMRVKIPQDYFNVINYFKSVDKNQHIALLPDYTYWGWFFNKWGYNGSGFLWYGIEQSIVSRTFDVWSKNSESYFWEVKTALEAEDLQKFEAVLDKYHIDYLILDHSLIPVVSSYKSLMSDRIEKLITSSNRISLVFKGKQLVLFQVSHPDQARDFINVYKNVPNIGPIIELTSDDTAFASNYYYLSDSKKMYDKYYPFLDMTTQTKLASKNWNIQEDENGFALSAKTGLDLSQYDLFSSPNYEADIFQDDKVDQVNLSLEKYINQGDLTVRFGKKLVESFDVAGLPVNDEFTFTGTQLPQRYGYLVKVKTKNTQGSPLFFYISDETKKQSVVEEKLRSETEYFILPDKFNYGLGYSFSFQNKSYQHYPSENRLEELSVYLLPYEALKNTVFTKKNTVFSPEIYNNFQADKKNYYTYRVNVASITSTSEDLTIVLNQSYDKGWIALSKNKLLPHMKFSNWANAWKLKGANDVLIIFWPQYLEFFGFLLLVIPFFAILLIKEKHE